MYPKLSCTGYGILLLGFVFALQSSGCTEANPGFCGGPNCVATADGKVQFDGGPGRDLTKPPPVPDGGPPPIADAPDPRRDIGVQPTDVFVPPDFAVPIDTIAPIDLSPVLPELMIKSVNVKQTGSNFEFEVEVCNVGATTNRTFDIELFYDRQTPPTCTSAANRQVVLSGLDAGKCQKIKLTRQAAPNGSYTAWIAVDADCKVTESDESNNKRSIPYKVSVALPDLVLETLSAKGNGTSIGYEVKICNKGANLWSAFDVAVYFRRGTAPSCQSSTSQRKWVNSGLAAGNCTTLYFTWTNPPGGNHLSWAQVDRACTIAEISETNNHRYVWVKR